ncbi:SatD family protein [Belliella aquatica]|nr:SatD family protein [Belliella aquatica]MCH7406907.1 SatD family protein [Belliella aquatica]
MADVIASTKLNSDILMKQFRLLVDSINNNRHNQLKSPLTITLGDEFQGVIDTIENGIDIIFDMEELRIVHDFDFKLRYVLHEGQIDTEINKNIAYQMLGEGLTKARESLSILKKSNNRFLIQLEDQAKSNALNKAFSIYQNVVDSWKKKDVALVKEFLKNDDYKVVAKIADIDPSNAWRRKNSLNIKIYKYCKEIILILLKN